ncbi:MAG: hypothetical protein Q8Q09_29025 [Deltaproteobacteria bacterium]|nr:hypothetical protein [Deltaproteobacteria bacterium]
MTPPPRLRLLFGSLLGLALGLAAASPAQANGRFPYAQHVVVRTGTDGVEEIVLRATFGLLWSRDGGQHFDWVCEQSMGFEGSWDPPIVFGQRSLIVGLPTGGSTSITGCDFAEIPTLAASSIMDLAARDDGRTVVAIESVPVRANRLFVSRDDGQQFAVLGSGPVNVSFDTVELAPSDPLRLYATGVDATSRHAVFYRSMDGGRSLQPIALPVTDANGAFVSAVDSADAQFIWLRLNTDLASLLYVSRDGGDTWREAYRGRGALQGFALAQDGRAFVGGPDDGLLLSTDRGVTWRSIATTRVACLRHHNRALYLCADWVAEPFALARIRDGETQIEPMLRFEDVRGAFACAQTTSAQQQCAPRWPAQRAIVTARRRDAGSQPLDADGLDGASDSGSAEDALSGRELATQPPRGCACRAQSQPPGQVNRSAISLLVCAALWVSRRRSRCS